MSIATSSRLATFIYIWILHVSSVVSAMGGTARAVDIEAKCSAHVLLRLQVHSERECFELQTRRSDVFCHSVYDAYTRTCRLLDASLQSLVLTGNDGLTGNTGSCQQSCQLYDVITCSTQVAPVNGQMTGSSFRYQEVVSFSCDPGYEPDTGSTTITCQANKQWTATALTCKKITCQAQVAPENGQMTGSSFRYQDFLSFSCDPGYQPDTGSVTITCQANQQWTATALTCTS